MIDLLCQELLSAVVLDQVSFGLYSRSNDNFKNKVLDIRNIDRSQEVPGGSPAAPNKNNLDRVQGQKKQNTIKHETNQKTECHANTNK